MSDTTIFLVIHFSEVFVNLEENDLEWLLFLEQVQDLEILLIESCLSLVDDLFDNVVRLLINGNSSSSKVYTEDCTHELLNHPGTFQEENENHFGV